MIFDSLLDRPLAQTLWDFNKLKHALKPADFLLLVCSYNLDVADYVDVLFMQKMGKVIVVSGGSTDMQGMARLPRDEPEWKEFKERLQELGNAENDIIVEDQAMRLFESIANTREKLTADTQGEYNNGIIVLPPHCERRAFATAQKEWPNVNWQVTSPNVTYDDYIHKYDEENLIHLLVGETQRIIDYGDKDFIEKQEMPDDVKAAYKKLLDKGYTKHLNKEG
jgi:hypothetical protein